jgi:hypothetical protein
MEKTFDLETKCKRLPVPELADTLSVYLQSLIPLTTDDELREVTAIAKDFQQTTGAVLQKRLLERCEGIENERFIFVVVILL